MLKYAVEAFSQESYEDALAQAMAKAAAFLTGHQSDAHVAIKSLNHSDAMGYHAVLEITIVPMSLRHELHVTGIFKETVHAHDRAFRLFLKEEHDHLQHVLDSHFSKALHPRDIQPVPDMILAALSEVDIENNQLEKKPHPYPSPHPEGAE